MLELITFALVMLVAQFAAIAMVAAACYIILCKGKTTKTISTDTSWVDKKEP